MAYMKWPRLGSASLKIAAIYLAVSVLWISGSDHLVALFFKDTHQLSLVQTLKGWFFVGSTSVLIYFLMQREIATYKKTSESLAKSSQELRDILDAMPVGVAVTDGTTIEYININFSKRYGYTLDEIPTDEQWFLLAYPDAEYRQTLLAKWNEEVQRVREQGGGIRPYEVRVTCKNGEVRQAIANTQLIGERIVIIFTDITERELLNNELIKIQKLESIGLLAGGLAHDFNNILTGIMGNLSYAQILLEQGHPAFAPLKAAEDAAGRAAEVTRQLLTFARGGEPVKKVVCLTDIINESMTLMLRGSQVQGEVDIPPEGVWFVEADSGQFSQVLNNIIINGVQAMGEGGTLKVRAENYRISEQALSALEPGEYVRICLEDNGPGMSPETMERVFDPYFTTKAEGSGLGLASAYSIITRHGGTISVDSILGKGTTFTLLVPATRKKPFLEEKKKPLSEQRTEVVCSRILVMDDEATIRDIASAMLDYLGYEAQSCSDGQEAVELYRRAQDAGQRFDAVIMDLTVPGGLGGKEAARQILAKDPSATLIVSSGYSHDPIMADFATYGFKGVLAKPYKADELSKVLGAILPA